MEFAMPLPLREDYSAGDLRSAGRQSKDSGQARRRLSLAAIYDGSTRTEAAEIGGVRLQIIRDWVLEFNAHGAAGLIAGKAPGQPARLTGEHRAALARMIEDGPVPAVHGVVRWRLVDLCQWAFEEYRVAVSVQTMSRELRSMGYRKLSARPSHHAQAANAVEDFKKASLRAWKRSRARRASTPAQ
jgi:transposase